MSNANIASYPTTERLTLLPVEDEISWNFYKTHMKMFWTAEEIHFGNDLAAFEKMNAEERELLLKVLAFFSCADTLVNINLQKHFLNEPSNTMEMSAFYGFQSMMETIHSETYAMQILNLIKNKVEREKVLNAVAHYPNVAMKIEWMERWIENEHVTHLHRLLAFILIEGIFFSCSFSSIFYFKNRGVELNGLIQSNELIAKDETLHQAFGTMVFNRLNEKIPLAEKQVFAIVDEAVQIESQFAEDMLVNPLPGLNKTLMIQYIHFLANTILSSIGYSATLYPTQKNPFEFMESCYEIETKTNFFEKKNAIYQHKNVGYDSNVVFDF